MAGYLVDPPEGSAMHDEPPTCKWCTAPLTSEEQRSGRWECNQCYDAQREAHYAARS